MEKLIRKFNDGSISSEELAFLIKKLQNKEVPADLQKILDEYWRDSSDKTTDLDAENNWNEILERIAKSGKIKSTPVAYIIRSEFLKTVLKYAAIFVLAFGISWLLNNWIKGKYLFEDNQYTKIEVSYGSKSNIELPDGSHVTLNSGSFIRYPNNFRRKGREIYFEGEAYFDIKKDISRPLIVKTSDVQINVIGTQFNVKAYPEEKNIETTLIKGIVEVLYKNLDSKKDEKIVLQPNHKLVIQKSILDNKINKQNNIETQNQIERIELPEMEYVPKPELFTSWKDNKLVFNNEPFEDIITKFERWYDISIIIKNPEIKSARLSGQFEKETIEQALNALTLTTPFQYSIDKNIITIYPKTE
jgi:transmembrane sensor